MISGHAQARPDSAACIEFTGEGGRRELTWSQLQEQSDRYAALLLGLGVSPGENVAYQLPNQLEFIVVTVAVLKVGAVCAPLMPIFRERELEFMLQRAHARVMIVPETFRGIDHRRMALAVQRDCPELEHVVALGSEQFPDTDGDAIAVRRPEPDDNAQLLFTSGTSGEPKGVLNTHRTLDTAAIAHINHFNLASAPNANQQRLNLAITSANHEHLNPIDLDRDGVDARDASARGADNRGADIRGADTHRVDTRGRDAPGADARGELKHVGTVGRNRGAVVGPSRDGEVVYSPSPIAHQTGFLYGMWLAFTLGAPFVFHRTWDAELGFRALTEGRVTFIQAATPFLADLVKQAQDRNRTPNDLRYFVATGAAVPRELAREARTTLNAEVGGGWGSTETCMGAAFVPGDPPEKAWSADGKPLDHVHIRIVDDSGMELPADTEGNFELKSPTMFDGYLERPDLTAEAFTADGYFRTGDLAKLDPDGYLHITGRVKDVVNRGGEKVPVAEVEQILYGHPLVADVAIVAMPDPRLGERACAFVVPASSGSAPGPATGAGGTEAAAGTDGAEPAGGNDSRSAAPDQPAGVLTFTAMQEYLDTRKVAKPYWPERLEIVDALPRTPSGKVQKYVLRERVARTVAEGNAVMR